ncbi:rodlin [Streptomyces sp. NPDC051907]|uniref:rodlin n=1 Tax=Streptomyces sp. NPDC051907 TaxID=3155284 RepID=UPI003429150E
MIKKILTTTMVAASMVGVGAAMAPQAMAIGNEGGTTSFSGNGAEQAFGNFGTHGDLSPQLGLVQGTLNKPCLGVPVKANLGALAGLADIAVQDVPILSGGPQNQQCTENSTQAKGDEPLAHVLSNIPVLSGNGAGNN